MKIGMRTPSLKKSIMGMTTSQIKRDFIRRIDPTYGKKGVGFIKNPNKAVYNQVYSRTTFGGISGLKRGLKQSKTQYRPQVNEHIFTELNRTDGLLCDIIRLLVWLRIIR